MNIVIIGNSAAAVGCIEGLRSADMDSKITVISDEPHFTYSRPLISYLLYGKTDEERMKYRKHNFYKQNNAELVHGKAVSIKDGKVTLENGACYPYDKLLAATGSKPFLPPMEGLENVQKKFTFMTLDDAKALGEAVDKSSKVLIVGAGLIGLKCAEGLFNRAGTITVIDLADRILPSILDEKGSGIMREYLEKKGIVIKTGVSAKNFTADKATLSDGTNLNFDVVVTAVGVRPNVELVKDAGGEVGRGIKTDVFSQTTLPNVYAAGDCAESFDISADESRILALLPNAYIQGETAGLHMAGVEKPYDKAIPMNAIGFFGYHIITAGAYVGEETVIDGGAGNYRKFYVKDGVLKGYILIGEVAGAGIYTELIRQKTPLDTIDFEILKTRPALSAFSKDYRKKKLANV